MMQTLGKPILVISSLVLMSVMFVVVMYFVNPSIDGGDGSGVLLLQLSFTKNAGIELIESWGAPGVENFKNWIFTDYFYAFSYALFFASLISYLAQKKRQESRDIVKYFVGLAFIAGFLDCVENSMELSFINDPDGFSGHAFFLHSVVAVLKWVAVVMVIAYILVLLAKRYTSDSRTSQMTQQETD